jgi:hypothetical protein
MQVLQALVQGNYNASQYLDLLKESEKPGDFGVSIAPLITVVLRTAVLGQLVAPIQEE